jgi:alkanesulfonate monooxygenase
MASDIANLRTLAEESGRNRSDILVFGLATIITAATDAEAEEKAEDYRQYVSLPGALALVSGWSGVDLANPDLQAAAAAGGNAIQGSGQALKGGAGTPPDREAIARSAGLGGGGPVLVGGPRRIADELEAWAEEVDLDGFNLAYAIMPESFRDVVELVVPELQRRGLFKKDYRPGTYREKLFGRGPRLEATHPAARPRRRAATGPASA